MKFFLTALLIFTITIGRCYNAADNNALTDSFKIAPDNKDEINYLTNLGMLWGFIKYYHPNVRRGEFDMDKELFFVLGKIVDAPNKDSVENIMDKWITHFGEIQICDTRREKYADSEISLQPDYGRLFDTNYFSKNIITKLNKIRSTANDTKLLQYYVGKFISPIFYKDKPYNDTFPSAKLRLLALYRYWNIIQYFYPYRPLIHDKWSNVLSDFIPVFYLANDTGKYLDACQRLIAKIGDSHSPIFGGISNKYYSNYLTIPFLVKYINNKFFILKVADTLGVDTLLHPGDEIIEVNGISMKRLMETNADKCSVANQSGLNNSFASGGGEIFAGKKPLLSLTITRDNRKIYTNIPRIPFSRTIHEKIAPDTSYAYRLIGANIGYIYPGQLTDGDLVEIKTAFKNTRGVIIDMRCYPKVFMPFSYGKWLKCKQSSFVKFSTADITMPGRFLLTGPEVNGGDPMNCYSGKVVIIVNNRTISQSEYTVMALASRPNTIVIGDTTAGTDGDVSEIKLPGGISSYMSGLGILYPDGRQTQKVGVNIDKIVRPTLKGILAGKDEQLDEAISLINNQ